MQPIRSAILLLFVVSISLPKGYAQSETSLYSFFIAGHTYGAPGVNNEGLHPPFVEKFDYIQNREEIKFGIFTGDIVVYPTAEDWDEVDEDIDSLGLPVYFAVGNHDMIDQPLFESRYGDTYYDFIYENDLFIILDPNLDSWNISGDQLEFLENVVDSNHQDVDNIFVFFHQLLCWEEDNIYSEITPNSFAGRADSINFWTEIEPIFSELENETTFCMGDLGAGYWSDDFMYDNYANITFVGSGMGHGVGDNFVVFNINTEKIVTYDLICLNDSNLFCFGELTDYQISLGILSTEKEDIQANIYPNPASNTITIEFAMNHNTSVQLFDLKGQLLFEESGVYSGKLEVNISKYSAGFYIVNVINEKARYNIKLIVR